MLWRKRRPSIVVLTACHGAPRTGDRKGSMICKALAPARCVDEHCDEQAGDAGEGRDEVAEPMKRGEPC